MIELEGKEPLEIKVNHNGDISYIELVSEENVEKVKAVYYRVVGGLSGERLVEGVEITDGEAKNSEDALERPIGKPTGSFSFGVDNSALKKIGEFLGVEEEKRE